mmetsp:Transcript_6989/g.10318  ORF Transcript_6989/g.10318 Transcript_6989/m.10318 type:complete len:99 (+) Transcript_6989:163-459(+)
MLHTVSSRIQHQPQIYNNDAMGIFDANLRQNLTTTNQLRQIVRFSPFPWMIPNVPFAFTHVDFHPTRGKNEMERPNTSPPIQKIAPASSSILKSANPN